MRTKRKKSPINIKLVSIKKERNKRFREIAEELGFEKSNFPLHSYKYGDTYVRICFYPCVFGVAIGKVSEAPHYKNNFLTEEAFKKILTNIKNESDNRNQQKNS